jgi:type II secretory pathway pseudopilin PulG
MKRLTLNSVGARERRLAMRARKRQNGYTLLDLMTVCGIASIVAATVVPNYVSMRSDAQQAATRSIAGALGSASAQNALLRAAGKASGIAITNCADTANLMMAGAIAGFSITAQPIASGETATCTVEHGAPGSGNASTFLAHGVS